ncbi:MAG: carboxypeptidase-like regulatory domain-containing protein, partial [Planctomycetota bacterium]
MKAFSSLRGLATATLATVLLGGAAHADTLTGQVVDPNGVGIVGATLTFTNGATPLNPVTGLNGVFAFVLNPGTYDISIDPGVAGVAPMQLFGVQVAGLTNLGTIQLQVGYTISGQIVDPAGLPVFGVDTDVRDAVTGARLFTPGDNTDLTGLFSVTVPAGTYRFDIRPPADPLLPLFAPRS